MKQFPKILMILAALSLLMVFVFPIWKITLVAPQYPEGISLHIWINKIGGDSPSTLQNINILNHYIGMKFIEPESIPELKYFPKIVIGLVVLGLLVAFTNKRRIFFGWALVVLILGLLSIYDFYLWEYDYGHNLHPTAPIKVPGMVYQPPLLGKKMLLNFAAYSWPHIGGWFIGVAIALGFSASWLKSKNDKNNEKSDRNSADVAADELVLTKA